MSDYRGNDGLAITSFFLAFIGIICAVVVPWIIEDKRMSACHDVCAPLTVMGCFDYDGKDYAACGDFSVREIK